MTNTAIQDLKNSLPDIPSCCPDLKKESATSLCGPCPRCDGTDRFVYKTDSDKAWCRRCHQKSMDKIDFHAWLEGKTNKDFLRERMSKNEPPPFRESPPDPDLINSKINKTWNEISQTHTNEKPVNDLFKRRGLSDAVIQKVFNAGLARFKNHARQYSVAVPYSTLQGETLAIQCLTVDGEPYSFTVDNGKPANKVMMKGSAIGKDCYFICGADINTAEMIIIAESVINALTALECFPDACCIALGGSTFTAKVKALEPYAERAEKVVVLVDNDDASEKMLRDIWDVLGMTVRSFTWDFGDPAGYDVNDALMAGQRDRVIDLIQNAKEVLYKDHKTPGHAEHKTPDHDADATNRKFKLIKYSDIEIKPADWLTQGCMETDSLNLLFSDPGGCKSFFAIDLSCCVATDKDFHGMSCKQGPVVFIAGEGQNGLKRRFMAWGIRHDIDLDQAPIFLSMMPASLCETDQVGFVITAIQAVADEYGAPVLVVLDTVARNFGPGDENSTQDMSGFIASIDKIREKFKSCILLVHHTGHTDKSRARGAMALKGALDTEYRLEKDETGVVRMTCTKMKDHEPLAPMAFRLNTVELPLQDDQGEQVTSAILDDTDYQPPTCQGKKGRGKWQTVSLEVLKKIFLQQQKNLESGGYDPNQARVKLDDWRSACMEAGMNREAWRRIKDNLNRNQDVEQDGIYVFPR